MGRRVLGGLLASAALVLTACGGGDSGGSRTLNWYIAFQPGGALQKIADACTQQSEGRYRINIELLPTQADQQREQLVRRLGAEDDAIDIVGMDVVWTGEFANAGWVQQVPEERRDKLTNGVFDSVLKTGQFEDKQFAVPIWSNTQLLWYRKDRVPKPPETWSEMLDQAEKLGPKEGRVQVQANRYEGLVVWANAMIASAGTAIITGPETIGLEKDKTIEALKLMERLGKSDIHAPNIDTSDEGTSALQFENGSSAFMTNYPFVYASAKANAPDVFKQMGAAKFPKVTADRESAPPLGGFNLGVSSYSKKQDLSWEAIECLVSEENQLKVTSLEGLPPVRPDLFTRKEVKDAYPGFENVIRDSIQDASPRPSESPAYADLSLAIQDALHPTTKLKAEKAYKKLRDNVQKAIKREGLL
jgi:multiple sugar transport system substrate-binding protein